MFKFFLILPIRYVLIPRNIGLLQGSQKIDNTACCEITVGFSIFIYNTKSMIYKSNYKEYLIGKKYYDIDVWG